MPRLLALILLLSLVGCDSDKPAAQTQPAGQFNRIVSVTLGTDEMLLDLVDPSRIAALSNFVDDPYYSNAAERAKAVPGRVGATAEQVLAAGPDLVLYASYNNPEFVSLIESAGVKAHKISFLENLEGMLKNLREIGRLVGEDNRAAAIEGESRAALEKVRRQVEGKPQPSVLYYDHGWIAGSGTIHDEILQLAGAKNHAAEKGISGTKQVATEVLQLWSPDVVLIVGPELGAMKPAEVVNEAPQLTNLPAVLNGRVYQIPNRIFTSTSHHAAKGPLMLAPILHEGLTAP